MKQTVVVKGNIFRGTQGITVIFDPDIPFESLCSDTAEKFRSLSGFLGKNKMAVAFEGRDLTSDEERILLNIITENSQISVLFLIENDTEKEILMGEKLDEAIAEAASKIAASQVNQAVTTVLSSGEHNEFYCGTLRSGQIVTGDGNVVIVGDVNPGGTVECTGSIIILGALKGVARAGICGNRNTFVVALEMNPTQIFISEAFGKMEEKKETTKGRLFSRSSDKAAKKDKKDKNDKNDKRSHAVPYIALYEDGGITVKLLDRDLVAMLEKRKVYISEEE